MKVFIVAGAATDGSYYLEEVLRAFGLCCVERLAVQDALAEANPDTDILIVPEGGEAEGLEAFLQSGGSAIVIRPGNEVAALAGLKVGEEERKPGRLRIVAPICSGARGEPLWTLGAQTRYESDLAPKEFAACTLAYLFEPGDLQSERAGIFQRTVGGGGSLTIFAYDPASCIARLRQGYPERANYTPPGNPIPRSIHLHEPDAPQDTAWRPTADLHAGVFCDVVKDLLSRYAPVPTLWHIPAGRPALLIFSGDEDGALQENNTLEMTDLESFGAAMNLYVIPNDTSITLELIENYTRRGHTISVHPDLLSTCGKSPDEQLAKAEADVLLMREKFGQAVHTVRNHCTMWPGYLDLPELWERLGIGMDANCFATRFMQSPDWGPYVNVDASIPLRFVREDGSLIDVYQQPTHFNDDVMYHPTVDYSQKYSVEQADWIARRIVEDAARFFHGTICANFHPTNYALFARQQGQAVIRYALEFNMPIWSVDRWHNFWRARAAWHMNDYSWGESRLGFTLTGPVCEDLWITLPTAFGGRGLNALSFNGEAADFEIAERFQRPLAQAALPADAKTVDVIAEYR